MSHSNDAARRWSCDFLPPSARNLHYSGWLAREVDLTPTSIEDHAHPVLIERCCKPRTPRRES